MGKEDIACVAEEIDGCIAACITQAHDNNPFAVEVRSDFVVVGVYRSPRESFDPFYRRHLGTLNFESLSDCDIKRLHRIQM